MRSVASGAPQVLVLYPLLFLININDLLQVTSNIHLFVDDCVPLRETTADCDTNSIQSDLDITGQSMANAIKCLQVQSYACV